MIQPGPLRVLFVNSQTELGGAEISLLTALKRLDRSRVEPGVATLGFGSGDYPAQLRAAGAEVFELRAGRARNPLAWLGTVLRLARLLRRGGFAAAVANGYHPHYYARPAAWLAGVRSVLFCRDFPRLEPPVPAVQRLAFLVGAHACLAASRAVAEAVRRRVGASRPVIVVPSGVDLDEFRPDSAARAAVRSELGIPEGAPAIACAGRLQPWKGQHVFLDAAATVARELPNARFLIVGDALFGQDAGYPRQLREQACRLGISERVVFTGWRRDMSAVYAASDVVVHGSVEPEPFGRVIAEAMACARPVVVARAGGAPDLFEEGVSGLGYGPGDVGEMAGAVLRLCLDVGLRQRLGRSARERVVRNCSQDLSARALAQALEGLFR